MLYQVEFLLKGNLFPLMFGEVRITESLLIEAAYSLNSESDKSNYALGFFATQNEGNYFATARNQIDFFIMIYALVSSSPLTVKLGVGTPLEDLESLGKNWVGLGGVVKLDFDGVYPKGYLNSIIKTKDRFLQLLPERQEIMENHLGIALIYYYYAFRARRLEERIINLMIAGEALLITRNTSIRTPISDRISALIAENEMDKGVISRRMRELYDLRSAIVHGGRKKPNLKDSLELLNYVQRAINHALDLRKLSKTELIEKLNIEISKK